MKATSRNKFVQLVSLVPKLNVLLQHIKRVYFQVHLLMLANFYFLKTGAGSVKKTY